MLFTIVVLGIILVFYNFSLIQLIFLMVIIIIFMPFLLGMISIGEVRSHLTGMKKTGFLKRLDEMKFFEKNAPATGQKLSENAGKTVPKTGVNEAKTEIPNKKTGILHSITSFMSSLGSLGTILSEKAKKGKKVEDINKMLDKAVSEKVTKRVPPAGTNILATVPPVVGPGPGTGGGGGPGTDPFLTLSNDDFDPGMLDGLEDEPASFPSPDGPLPDGGKAAERSSLPEPELSMPTLEDSESSPALPSDSGIPPDEGLDAFQGLDSGDALDEDFGDLDNLNLDDVELDEETDGSTSAEKAPSPEGAAAPLPSALPEDSGEVKTAWVPSDAPKGADMAEDQVAVQSDMASFASASGSGSDEDLLSSIASDVKTVKKEKDISLLRELKDFKAPAAEIENELKDMFSRMNVSQKPKETKQPPSNGIK